MNSRPAARTRRGPNRVTNRCATFDITATVPAIAVKASPLCAAE